MIPSFLRSLAILLRQLIAAGRAVHCTETDAAELELLAGLPWGKSGFESVHSRPGATIWVASPEPADIALGWLRASRVVPDHEDVGGPPFEEGLHEVDGDRIKRAAVCAELVALSILALVPMTPQFGGELRIETHLSGAIEGARAAWGHIIEQLVSQVAPVRVMSVERGMVGYCHPLNSTIDKYRRELEAMK